MRRMAFILPLLLLAAACSPSAPAPPSKPLETSPRPAGVEVLAHRGGSPENTLSAFRGALADPGVGAIELDVQPSKDGELFVIHDLTLDRTTDGYGDVRALKSAELRKLKTPKGGGTEAVPTLREVVQLLAGHKEKRAFVELKAPVTDAMISRLMSDLQTEGVIKRTVIISFEAAPLLEVRKRWPGAVTGLVAREVTPEVLSFPGEYLLMRHTALNPESMAKLKATGKWIYAWTVNDRPRMQEVLAFKVDGIISDNWPEAVKARDAK